MPRRRGMTLESRFETDSRAAIFAIRNAQAAVERAWDDSWSSGTDALDGALVDLVNATETLRDVLRADRELAEREPDDWGA